MLGLLRGCLELADFALKFRLRSVHRCLRLRGLLRGGEGRLCFGHCILASLGDLFPELLELFAGLCVVEALLVAARARDIRASFHRGLCDRGLLLRGLRELRILRGGLWRLALGGLGRLGRSDILRHLRGGFLSGGGLLDGCLCGLRGLRRLLRGLHRISGFLRGLLVVRFLVAALLRRLLAGVFRLLCIGGSVLRAGCRFSGLLRRLLRGLRGLCLLSGVFRSCGLCHLLRGLGRLLGGGCGFLGIGSRIAGLIGSGLVVGLLRCLHCGVGGLTRGLRSFRSLLRGVGGGLRGLLRSLGGGGLREIIHLLRHLVLLRARLLQFRLRLGERALRDGVEFLLHHGVLRQRLLKLREEFLG